MKCPKCNNTETRVIDTRPDKAGSAVRRRRVCSTCGHKMFTMELDEDTPATSEEILIRLLIGNDTYSELLKRAIQIHGIVLP